MTREEALSKILAGQLPAERGVHSGLRTTHKVVQFSSEEPPGPLYAHGIALTKDYGNQTYAAWLTHVCGDAIVSTGPRGPTVIGNIADAVMGYASSV